MDDEQARVVATAILQDACADGEHIYVNGWHDGLNRCACGKVHPDDLARLCTSCRGQGIVVAYDRPDNPRTIPCAACRPHPQATEEP